MASTILISIAAASLGQIALALSMLLPQLKDRAFYRPLVGLFGALGVVLWALLSLSAELRFSVIAVAMTLPALLALGPLLWVYTEALTAETRWHWHPRYTKHLLLPGIGAGVSLLALLLPGVRLREMLFSEVAQLTASEAVLAILAFVLLITWPLFSLFYLIRLYRQLTHYRKRLRDLFSSTEQREMAWLSALTMTLGATWLLFGASLLADNLWHRPFLGHTGATLLCGLLVWVLCLWGLRQKPGFDGRYQLIPEAPPGAEQGTRPTKYNHSALGSEQAQRLAGKLEQAMTDDKLYLDPNLSLQRLCDHIGTSSNYLSQTLNDTLKQSFFDYVNGWRVKAAAAHLRCGDDSIIDIAVAAGFNSRSSFYTAFKKRFGQTPSEYRRAPSAD